MDKTKSIEKKEEQFKRNVTNSEKPKGLLGIDIIIILDIMYKPDATLNRH